jgi:hypothetical protein
MKRFLQGIMIIMMLLVTVVAAQAVLLGDTSQDASVYDEDIIEIAENTFTVTNNTISSNVNLTCIIEETLDYINDPNTKAYNNINASLTPSTISNFSNTTSTSVKIVARVPDNLPAIDKDTLRESSFKVGDVICVDESNNVIFTEEIFMQRDPDMFFLRDITVEYNNNEYPIRNDGDELRGISPGTDMSLDVRLENNFIADEKIDFNIDATFSCGDRRSPIYVNNKNEKITLRYDDIDYVSFDLEFPIDMERGSYDCDLKIEAITKDDAKALFGDYWQIRLEVERERDEITIESLSLSPSVLTCTTSYLTASLGIRNTGYRDDRDIKLEVSISDWGISEEITGLELDSTYATTRQFSLTIPEDVKPGSYEVLARAYSKGVALTDTETVTLVVPDCNPAPPVVVEPQPQPQPEPPVVVIEQPPVENVTVEPVVEDEEKVRNNTALYVALLIVLILVIISGIVGILIYLIKG